MFSEFTEGSGGKGSKRLKVCDCHELNPLYVFVIEVFSVHDSALELQIYGVSMYCRNININRNPKTDNRFVKTEGKIVCMTENDISKELTEG